MKKLLYSMMVIVGITCISMSSNAQGMHKKKDRSGIDSTNVKVQLEQCTIDKNGIVRDPNGTKIGIINKEGIITNEQNIPIGRREKTDAELISEAHLL